MSLKVIALYHIKGGVGKTAAAVNLAWQAAQSGHKTLLCDLDPQGAASFYFQAEAEVSNPLKPLMKGGDSLVRSIRATHYPGLDLLPADLNLRHMDHALDEARKPRKQLRKALEPLVDYYDLVFLDCPPNLTLVAENVFRVADVVLCPVVPTTLSMRTFEQLRDFLAREEIAVRLVPFFSMVEKRKALQRDILAQAASMPGVFLPAAIPYLAEVERMGVHRAPVGAVEPRSPAARAFKALFQAVLRL